MIFHDNNRNKTCQREHVNKYSLHFLYAKRRTEQFWNFFLFVILRGVKKLEKSQKTFTMKNSMHIYFVMNN